MQTYINPTEQNNDHTGIIHKIQFRSSFRQLIFSHCFLILLSSVTVIKETKTTRNFLFEQNIYVNMTKEQNLRLKRKRENKEM